MNEFGNKPDNLVEFAWTAKPGDFGKYAPRIFQYAREGDPTAHMLLKHSAAYVSETLEVLIGQGAERISLLGAWRCSMWNGCPCISRNFWWNRPQTP